MLLVLCSYVWICVLACFCAFFILYCGHNTKLQLERFFARLRIDTSNIKNNKRIMFISQHKTIRHKIQQWNKQKIAPTIVESLKKLEFIYEELWMKRKPPLAHMYYFIIKQIARETGSNTLFNLCLSQSPAARHCLVGFSLLFHIHALLRFLLFPEKNVFLFTAHIHKKKKKFAHIA